MSYDSFFQWLFQSVYKPGEDPLITLTAYTVVMFWVCRLSWYVFDGWLDIFIGLGCRVCSRLHSVFERRRGKN